MESPVNILVVVEGGVVTGVRSSSGYVTVRVVDLDDPEPFDDELIAEYPQDVYPK